MIWEPKIRDRKACGTERTSDSVEKMGRVEVPNTVSRPIRRDTDNRTLNRNPMERADSELKLRGMGVGRSPTEIMSNSHKAMANPMGNTADPKVDMALANLNLRADMGSPKLCMDMDSRSRSLEEVMGLLTRDQVMAR